MLWPGLLTGTHRRPKVSRQGYEFGYYRVGRPSVEAVAGSGDPATTRRLVGLLDLGFALSAFGLSVAAIALFELVISGASHATRPCDTHAAPAALASWGLMWVLWRPPGFGS